MKYVAGMPKQKKWNPFLYMDFHRKYLNFSPLALLRVWNRVLPPNDLLLTDLRTVGRQSTCAENPPANGCSPVFLHAEETRRHLFPSGTEVYALLLLPPQKGNLILTERSASFCIFPACFGLKKKYFRNQLFQFIRPKQTLSKGERREKFHSL